MSANLKIERINAELDDVKRVLFHLGVHAAGIDAHCADLGASLMALLADIRALDTARLQGEIF